MSGYAKRGKAVALGTGRVFQPVTPVPGTFAARNGMIGWINAETGESIGLVRLHDGILSIERLSDGAEYGTRETEPLAERIEVLSAGVFDVF